MQSQRDSSQMVLRTINALRTALSNVILGRRRCSRLLDLPVNILAKILLQLPPHALLIMSEVCPIIRRLCHTITPNNHLSYAEHLRYLTCQSRNDLDRWVCKLCVKTHRHLCEDIPARSVLPNDCVSRWSTTALPEDNVAGCRSYSIAHRHIQFALKYSRLEGNLEGHRRQARHRHYYEQILASRQSTFSTHPLDSRHRATYSVFPEIVQANFLIHSVWTYQTHDYRQDVDKVSIGYLRICEHQGYLNGSEHAVEKQKEELMALMGELQNAKLLKFGILSAWQWLNAQSQVASYNVLPNLIDRAMTIYLNGEIAGSCAACLTDFVVKVSPGELKVFAWQDLGHESSLLDTAERSPPPGLRWGYALDRRNASHQPGSVRRKYEGTPYR